jgi:hypothetical protein
MTSGATIISILNNEENPLVLTDIIRDPRAQIVVHARFEDPPGKLEVGRA